MRILYVDIDSLRADHLGCYGYHRRTSPNIDALAKEGVRFTNVYVSDAPCLPPRTALHARRMALKYAKRLRETGRAHHADALMAAHPEELQGVQQ